MKQNQSRKGRYLVLMPGGDRSAGTDDFDEAKKQASEKAGSRIYEKGVGVVFTYYPPLNESLATKFLRVLVKLRDHTLLGLGR